MQLSLDRFCELLTSLGKTNAEKAMAVLWYFDYAQLDVTYTSRALATILDDHHVGTPNATQLAVTIRKTKLAKESKQGFSLKPGSRSVIRGWFPTISESTQPPLDQATGYLPEAIWGGTRRGYIDAVCKQINGCFAAAFYDAASVMLRRLLETLVIESYEAVTREAEIKDGSGNYFMLADLAERACGEKGHRGLHLGRDSKKTLKEAREVGNWAAHARRYTAVPVDLTKIQSGVRLLVQELVEIAQLKKSKNLN